MTLFKRAIYILLLAVTLGPLESAAIVPNPSGLWYTPSEPGWGISIQQQADTLFVVLFAHDEAARPVWYVASALRRMEDPAGGVPFYRGDLYRAEGTPLGPPFQQGPVTIVGQMNVVEMGLDQRKLMVAYNVGNIFVAKVVEPQTWASSLVTALGSYEGATILNSREECPVDPGVSTKTFTIAGNATGPGRVRWVFGSRTGQLTDSSCEAEGPWVSQGQLASFTAPLRCGITSSTPVGSVTVTWIAPSLNGLSGAISLTRGACTYQGRIAGARAYP